MIFVITQEHGNSTISHVNLIFSWVRSLSKGDVDENFLKIILWCYFTFVQSFLDYLKSLCLQNETVLFAVKRSRFVLVTPISWFGVVDTETKNENARCKACKTTVFVVKHANLWRSCRRVRRGCLSSQAQRSIDDVDYPLLQSRASSLHRNLPFDHANHQTLPACD